MWILYDTIDLLNAVRDEGTLDGNFSPPAAFTESATVSDPERAHDQNVYQAVSSFAKSGTNIDTIRWDLGSAKSIDTLALHFLAAETDDMVIGLKQ